MFQRVKYAVYPLYLTGNIADSTAVHRKPRKNYRPVQAVNIPFLHCTFCSPSKHVETLTKAQRTLLDLH